MANGNFYFLCIRDAIRTLSNIYQLNIANPINYIIFWISEMTTRKEPFREKHRITESIVY